MSNNSLTSKDVLERLADLLKQTEARGGERTYTAAVCREAIAEIKRLQPAVETDVRRDLVAGICAAANGNMEKADAILDKYWPGRPKLGDWRKLSFEEAIGAITGVAENGRAE